MERLFVCRVRMHRLHRLLSCHRQSWECWLPVNGFVSAVYFGRNGSTTSSTVALLSPASSHALTCKVHYRTDCNRELQACHPATMRYNCKARKVLFATPLQMECSCEVFFYLFFPKSINLEVYLVTQYENRGHCSRAVARARNSQVTCVVHIVEALLCSTSKVEPHAQFVL